MKKISLLLPVIAGSMFGAAGIFVRGLRSFGISNVSILFLRSVIASVVLFLFLLIYNKNLLKIAKKDIPIFFGTGILGMSGVTLFYNEAVSRLSLSLTAVLTSLSPVFVIIFAFLLFGEKITQRKLLSMFAAIIGCTFSSGLLEQQNGINFSLSGIAFGVASALFYALYSIFSKKATDKGYHTYTIIFYSVLFITIALSPFAQYGKIHEFILISPLKNSAFLFANSLCTSILPYVFITVSLMYAEAGKVSILASGAEPVAAVIFGIMIYSEIPSALMLLGLIITISALTMLCLEPKKKKQA